MKTINLKSLLLIIVFLVTGATSFAAIDSLYVCAGNPFTLKSALTAGINYSWSEIGGSASSDTNTFVQTVTLSSATHSEMKEYVLTIDSVNACTSYDTFHVFVLPALTATITTPESAVCSNESATATLTASVGTLSVPTGITVGYTWGGAATGTGATVDVSVPDGSTSSIIASVAPAYESDLFAPGNNKLTGCYTNGSITITRSAPPAIPTVTLE